MTQAAPIRGGSPVAQLDTLPAAEARLVRQLRHWCESAEGREAVRRETAALLGPEAARAGLADFEELVTLLARYGRRPLMHHASSCMCVGADEAVFANFVMTAAEGAREDAMLVASLLVRADLLGPVVELAERVGLGAARMSLRERHTAAPQMRH